MFFTCSSFQGSGQSTHDLELIRNSCKQEAATCINVLERKGNANSAEKQKCQAHINTSKSIGAILETRHAAEVKALPVATRVIPKPAATPVPPRPIAKAPTKPPTTAANSFLQKKQALAQANQLKMQRIQASANARLQQAKQAQARIQQQLNQFNQISQRRFGGSVVLLPCSF
jgi:hypothetical protein